MFLGADTEAVRDHAARMRAAVRTLEARAQEVRACSMGVDWQGGDADGFRAGADGTVRAWESACESLQRRAAYLEAQAGDQDAVSQPDDAGAGSGVTGPTGPTGTIGPGGVLGILSGKGPLGGGEDPARPAGAGWIPVMPDYVKETLLTLTTPDPGPSQGLIGDAFGPDATAWWNRHEVSAAGPVHPPGPQMLDGFLVDVVNSAAGVYEVTQGMREGDALSVADGIISTGIAQTDLIARTLMLTPVAPVGAALSVATGMESALWGNLRGDAMADPDAQGSPVRYVLQGPERLNDRVLQPAAAWIGGPVGEMIGGAGDTVDGANARILGHLDAGGRAISDAAQARIPGLAPALAAPRSGAELPRHVAGDLLGV